MKRPHKWPAILWETILGNFLGSIRTRILIAYLLLTSLTTGLTSLTVWYTSTLRWEKQYKLDLAEEVEELHRTLKLSLDSRINRENKNKNLQPTREIIIDVFDSILFRDIPDSGEFMVVFLDKKLYGYSPITLPPLFHHNPKILENWGQQTESRRGVLNSKDGNQLFYAIEPIHLSDGSLATYAIVNSSAPEKQLLEEMIGIIVKIDLLVLGLMSTITWFVAGKVLKPLRTLIKTIRLVSSTDLSQRIAVVGTGEVTELTQTFNEMLDRLQAMFTTQQNFINDAGHELRTPITIIRCHLEAWHRCSPEQYQSYELVLGELNRMGRIVNDLMLLARSERPNFLVLDLVTIEDFMADLFVNAKSLGERHWQLLSESRVRVVADRERLFQAMLNLIQNAVQHTTAQDKIRLGAKVHNEEIWLWVEDTGDGIAPEEQSRIFERFARGKGQHQRSEGAGLGLAIVQAIVKAHNGQIQLNSSPGKGTTFTLILPLDPPASFPHEQVSPINFALKRIGS